jgi:hypothetical protein
MHETFRIVEGEIKPINSEVNLNIRFGLLYLTDGIYYFDIYFFGNKFRADYFNKNIRHDSFSINCLSDSNYTIQSNSLSLKFISSEEHSKITFYCSDYFSLTSKKEIDLALDKNISLEYRQREPFVSYIELEGLDLYLADTTYIDKYRNEDKIEDFFNYEHDHLRIALKYVNSKILINTHYNLIFFKNTESKNYWIEIVTNENKYFSVEAYESIKNDFISLLSFANGGIVKVRKEFIGKITTFGLNNDIDSSKINIFSFKTIENGRLNDYLGIGEQVHGGNNMLNLLFLYCFQKFSMENTKLNFESIIYNINRANSISSIEERYYILITILEKLAYRYNQYNKSKTNLSTVVESELFNHKIKIELVKTLNVFEKEINDQKKYLELKSKLCSINQKSLSDTKDKILNLFEYANIPITSTVLNLVNIERNTAVHQGEFGVTDRDKIKNYLKLDHIIRDIILNAIGYKGFRKRRIRYFEGENL